jgi:hypothetical protein
MTKQQFDRLRKNIHDSYLAMTEEEHATPGYLKKDVSVVMLCLYNALERIEAIGKEQGFIHCANESLH